jgi:hypothetical protein
VLVCIEEHTPLSLFKNLVVDVRYRRSLSAAINKEPKSKMSFNIAFQKKVFSNKKERHIKIRRKLKWS